MSIDLVSCASDFAVTTVAVSFWHGKKRRYVTVLEIFLFFEKNLHFNKKTSHYCTMSSDATLNALLSFNEEIREVKRLLRSNSEQSMETINELKGTVNTLTSQVVELNAQVADLKDVVRSLEAEPGHSLGKSSSFEEVYPTIRQDKNPFKDLTYSRNVLAPKDENILKWEHFKLLGQEVLGEVRLSEEIFATFKKNTRLYADSLARHYQNKHKLFQGSTWTDINSTDQDMLLKVMEDGVGKQYPLDACVSRWGARWLLKKSFYKTKGERE